MPMIDYFKPAVTAEEEMIRRIKGNYRRQFVSRALEDEGVDSTLAAILEVRKAPRIASGFTLPLFSHS